jgi:hypothetical protein
MMRNTLIVVLVLSGLALAAGAETLAFWDISNARGPGASGTGLVEGISVTDLDSHGVKDWRRGWGYRGLAAATRWGRDELDPNKYFEFSVTGQDVHYETMTLSLTRGNAGGKRGHGADKWALRSSVDGFGEDLFLVDLAGTDWDRQTVFTDMDISAVGTRSGEVTFRLYGYGDTYIEDYSGLTNLGRNNLGVTGRGADLSIGGAIGTTVVPEPTVAALLAVGGMGVLRRRRGKR